MIGRTASVQRELRLLDLPAMLITNIADVKYLSGFTGSAAYMIIDLEKASFFTDGRYDTQSKEEVSDTAEINIVKEYSSVFLKECARYDKILLQPSCPLEISSKISSNNVEIYMDEKDVLKRLRMIKDAREISMIKEQYDLAGKAFLKSLKSFKYGAEERSWAAALEYRMKTMGAKGESFETIVASGARGAMPHGTASAKKINKNEPVIVDFGSRSLYTSDYTRMIYDGNDEEVLNIIDIVRNALEKAIEAVTAGKPCKEIDETARNHIEEKGFGKYFNHSLGHGVGIDVHELPVLNSKSDMIIEDNMVFTVEPGIYLPDKFGVRLEETVLVSGGKAEIISSILDKYVYGVEDIG